MGCNNSFLKSLEYYSNKKTINYKGGVFNMTVLQNIFMVTCIILSIISSICFIVVAIKVIAVILDQIISRLTDDKINLLYDPPRSIEDYGEYIFVPLGLSGLVFVFAVVSFLCYLALYHV